MALSYINTIHVCACLVYVYHWSGVVTAIKCVQCKCVNKRHVALCWFRNCTNTIFVFCWLKSSTQACKVSGQCVKFHSEPQFDSLVSAVPLLQCSRVLEPDQAGFGWATVWEGNQRFHWVTSSAWPRKLRRCRASVSGIRVLSPRVVLGVGAWTWGGSDLWTGLLLASAPCGSVKCGRWVAQLWDCDHQLFFVLDFAGVCLGFSPGPPASFGAEKCSSSVNESLVVVLSVINSQHVLGFVQPSPCGSRDRLPLPQNPECRTGGDRKWMLSCQWRDQSRGRSLEDNQFLFYIY